jgi:iron complex outermembrane receptor protein
MMYFSWGKGRKPSGINAISAGGAATTIDEERFDSEIMENFEFGWKTGWELGGALQFNGALFFQDYTDKQIGTQILVPDSSGGFRSNPRVINASSAEVWGLELEAIWQPNFMEGLVLQGGYTFLETQYTDFVDETTTITRAASVGDCPVVWKDGEDNTVATGSDDPNLDENLYPVADREYDVVTGDLFAIYAPKCALNLSGNELERAPENAFVGNISLTRPFLDSGMDWYTSLNAVYQDERFLKADNFVKWDDYWLFDFQLGVMNESLELIFYIENLFDDDTLRSGGEGPDFGPTQASRGFSAGLVQLSFFGPLPPPRRAGVRLSMRF